MSATHFQALGLMMGAARRMVSAVWETEARLRGAEIGRGVLFLGRPIMSVAPGSTLRLEGENQVASSPRCNPLGNAQPCVLRTLGKGARLELGRAVGLSSAALCAAKEIVVGEATIIGAGAMIIDNDFHERLGEIGWGPALASNARPVHIGRGCFIGARAIVLKGVTIGDRAVIGAGAVITKDVPARAFAVGNPARILPLRDEEAKR